MRELTARRVAHDTNSAKGHALYPSLPWKLAQLSPGLQRRVFLVGPNASGKSNFLDVFRFLFDLVTVGGGFQEAIRKRGGVSKLRCLAARKYPDVMVKLCIGDDERRSAWEYTLRFSQGKRQRPVLKEEKVRKDGADLLITPVQWRVSWTRQ